MKTIYNRMDPGHYGEEWEPSAEEAADQQAEVEEERKETAVERYIRSIVYVQPLLSMYYTAYRRTRMRQTSMLWALCRRKSDYGGPVQQRTFCIRM